MVVDTHRPLIDTEFLSRHRALVGTILAGIVMLLIGQFWLRGPIAGMFGVWGASVILVGVGGHLSLRLWTLYNR